RPAAFQRGTAVGSSRIDRSVRKAGATSGDLRRRRAAARPALLTIEPAAGVGLAPEAPTQPGDDEPAGEHVVGAQRAAGKRANAAPERVTIARRAPDRPIRPS